ncbi:hypothetical protein [Azospirillum picis]|uniref:Uncharacterized protein n=1 Tax=Azospirillum picis TaxID=488438 RepID=A0ABU0MT79_9PROT|nr:hypothetical protein [Azospirillum picis]MBP2302945.1 hypothetical protein [Azospirillum picis]MDQ0536697.1 hypothetical protein [Azospirillum picis]
MDGCREHREAIAGVDRRLLVVALALAMLTLLAVLDRFRPVPGAAPPVEWTLPTVELPGTLPMARAPGPRRDDELLGAD